MKYILTIIQILIFFKISGQSDDHSIPLANLYSKGSDLIAKGDFEQAVVIFEKGVKISSERHFPDSEAMFLGNMAVAYQYQNKLYKALELYDKALIIGYKIFDTTIIAGNLLNMGMVYKHQGIYDKALEDLILASKYFYKIYNNYKNPLDEEDLASCYNSIGDLYRILGNYNLSKENYFIGLKLRIECNNIRGVAGSLNHIGEFFRDIGEYDSALFYLNKSLAIKRRLPDAKFATSTLLNIGSVLLKKKDFVNAEKYFKQIINYNDLINNQALFSEACNELASLYFYKKEYPKALEILVKGMKIEKQENLRPLLLKNYDLHRKIYRALNNFPSAIFFDDLYINLKDTILNEIKNKALADSEIKYETQKKEQQIFILHEQEKNQHIKIISLFISFSLAIILIMIVIYGLQQERKNKREIEELMQELNHRVKNNLQMLKSLLSMQYNRLSDENAKVAVKEIENRVQSIMHIHEKLYHSKNVTLISLNEYILEILKDLQFSYGYNSSNLDLDINLDEFNIGITKALRIGLIVNEIVSNTFKHAFKNIENPALSISLKCMGSKTFVLRISDNGIGLSSKEFFKNIDSFGVKLILLLSKQLNASLETRSENGTTYILKMEK